MKQSNSAEPTTNHIFNLSFVLRHLISSEPSQCAFAENLAIAIYNHNKDGFVDDLEHCRDELLEFYISRNLLMGEVICNKVKMPASDP